VRLVLDTNTIVSGFLWGGNPRRLMEAGRGQVVHLFTSPEIMEELAGVLKRPKFSEVLLKAGVDVTSLLRRFSALVQPIMAAPIPVPEALRDVNDAHVLACAVAARAEAIVSGDKDLLSMKSFAGIPILTAKEALLLLGLGVN
jgi:uncharacterized protein